MLRAEIILVVQGAASFASFKHAAKHVFVYREGEGVQPAILGSDTEAEKF